jgi:hypothetical protein
VHRGTLGGRAIIIGFPCYINELTYGAIERTVTVSDSFSGYALRDAYTDAEDAFAVLDLVSDWLVDLSVNAGVHLHVIPLPQEAAALHVCK